MYSPCLMLIGIFIHTWPFYSKKALQRHYGQIVSRSFLISCQLILLVKFIENIRIFNINTIIISPSEIKKNAYFL